jgi:low temperature requirement protein LtrA
MDDQRIEQPSDRAQRVTPLELFFDLVVVFAITQVSTFLSRDATWGGLLRGLLLLGALWWAWSSYAWLTNAFDPEEGAVRLAMLAAIAAMLIVSLAAPRAFGTTGVTFGVAYLVVRGLHLILFAKASRRDRDRDRVFAVERLAVSLLAPVLLLLAGFVHGDIQLALWGVALAILYVGPLVGHMRGFRVAPAHFAERYGLIVIIAIGESIVAIGVAAGLPLDKGVIAAALLGITVSACLWWSYFDWMIYALQARLAELTGSRRSAMARDAYAYLHLLMVAGIVLFAFGLKRTLGNESARLAAVPALGLSGGLGLYFLAHVLTRLRLRGDLGVGRPIATLALFGLVPVATLVPALAALGIVAGVCLGLIAYEVTRYRASRAFIRDHRDGFTQEEAAQSEPPRRRARRRSTGRT